MVELLTRTKELKNSYILYNFFAAEVSSSSTVDIEVLGLGCKLQPVTSPCELPETCEPSDPCEALQLDCNCSIYSDTVPSLLFLAVLKKENVTLDLEIENLKLKEKEIT